MKAFPHVYTARVTGGTFAYGELTSNRVPALRCAPPPQFEGPGDAWSPEQLFLAAVQSCFLFTFRAVARASRFEFVALEVDARGTVDRREGVTRFTDIGLNVALVVPAGTDRGRALAVLLKAKDACLVSASISTPIRVNAAIHDAPAVALPAAG